MLKNLLPILVFVGSAAAQTHSRAVDFVPKGWEIELSLNADLTNDGLPDIAMVIVEKIGKDALEENIYNRRSLLVIKNTSTGFELIGKNDSGLLWSANVDSEVVAIPKGDSGAIVLQSKQGALMLREAVHFGIQTDESRFTFRYNPQHNRMQQIGADCSNFERDGYGDDDISINFLTGNMIEEKSVLDNNDKATDRLKKHAKRLGSS